MFRRIARIFEFFYRRRRLERELDEELRSGFEILADRFASNGLSPAEARRAARIEFEGLDQTKEKVRDGLYGATLGGFLRDLGYAWRSMCRRPSFALIAVLTLTLGIGINASVFSVFYGAILRPLPYDRPEQLALIWATLRSAGHARAPVSGAILGEVTRENRSLSGVAGVWTLTRTFTGDVPELVKFAKVTTNFFDVLGVHAARGRTFLSGDAGQPTLLLADGFFKRRFGGDPVLLGKTVPVQGGAYTLAGVLPAGFQLQFAPDANIPPDVQGFDTFSPGISAQRGQYYIRMVARLKPGVSVAQAQDDLDRVAAAVRAKYTEYGAEDLRFTVAPMQADAVRDVKTGMFALFGGAAFVLLICCVNITGLLVSRAMDRRREMALRLALGASRARILRQLLAEGVLLCLLGGIAGTALGWAGFRGLLAIRPERLARIADSGLDWHVLAFIAACSMVAALLFGFVPAIEAFHLELIQTLRATGRGLLGRVHRRAGSTLVAAEIAAAFILVTGAALAARTLGRIEQVRPGFDPRHALAFQISSGIPFHQIPAWEAQLAALPGIERVGAVSHLPLDTDIPNWYGPYRAEGLPASDAMIADLRCVTPGYFGAMGVRMLEGRAFTPLDRAGSRAVAIVDEMLARTTWPGESALDKTIYAEHATRDGFESIPSTVVGVVEHIHNHSLTKAVRGQIYMPVEQSGRYPLTFVLRSRIDPLPLIPTIRGMLHDRSKTAALAKVRLMNEYIDREVAPVSFTAILAAIFGAVALLLAAIGIYGVLNYQVSRRLPEMGVRMAFGASARDVLALVLRESLGLAAAGLLLGLGGAFVAAHWLRALIYGVSPRDPLSYVTAFILLSAAALAGCWRPARRAAQADPAQIIRDE